MPDLELVKPIVLDLIDTKSPAESATSDMPVIETQPDSIAAPEAEVEGKTTEEPAPAEQTVESTASDEPKKPAKGVQKRLDELVKQREDERRAREAAEARLDMLIRAQANRPEPQAVKSDEEPEPVRPSRDAFALPDEYDKALDTYAESKATWIARREVKATIAEERTKQAEENARIQQVNVQQAYLSRVEKAMQKYPDYKEVAESASVTVSMPIAHTILNSEIGPDLAHYLGTNPDEAKRISAMTVTDPYSRQEVPDVARQLVELGLVMAKLQTPPQAKPLLSTAPKPIKPLESSGEVTKTAEEESMDEYAARRRKELQAQARPGVRH